MTMRYIATTLLLLFLSACETETRPSSGPEAPPACSGTKYAGASGGLGGATTCTLVDCDNQFFIDLTSVFQPDRPLSVQGSADGEPFTCEADESTGFRREPLCSSEAIALGYSRVHGEPLVHVGLTFRGVPCVVDLRVVQDDTILAEASFSPEYQFSAPNGIECGPLCWSASASVAPQD